MERVCMYTRQLPDLLFRQTVLEHRFAKEVVDSIGVYDAIV